MLGTFLFFIYTNDLFHQIKHNGVHHLVDDTNILRMLKVLERLMIIRE